ncbi:MAG: ABC transporter permease [Deltaproteobacteria bacterium]|nr:ABC transporter permease [Deltaproteobacteria bacterium]
MKIEEVSNQNFQLEEPPAPKRTRLQAFWRVFRKNRLAILGFLIFLLFFFSALIGLFLTSGKDPLFNPSMIRLQEKLRPPMAKPNIESLRPEEVPELGLYLMGTDDLGRDVFARMLQGAWVSLTVGFVAVGISVLIGIFMGGIAGYFGQHYIRVDHVLIAILLATNAGLLESGRILYAVVILCLALAYIIYLRFAQGKTRGPRTGFLSRNAVTIDTLIMRLVDIMLCFPSFFLILTVVALLPASIYNIMIVIGLTSWMGTTRFVRAEFLSLREQDFVAAVKALGVGNFRIIFRHMMPNAIAPVLVSATIGIASAILTEAGLSFLGFGVPPPHATWGNILSDGKRFIFDAPWLTFIPGVAILIVVLSFNLFGEGLRDTLNPKLRERH